MNWTDLLFKADEPMLFNSGLFYTLFLLFVMVYLAIYQRRILVFSWVLLFSWYFYYKSSGIFLALFLLTLVKDYAFAIWIEKLQTRSARLWMLWLSILSSLSVLFYFKYTNFVFGNLMELLSKPFAPWDLVLPIGISFYTFQSISYVADVYQGRVPASKRIAEYAFYMSFFPHMVAGPIVKANHFLPQLRRPVELNPTLVWSGFLLVLTGLFKKAVVADYIAQYNDLVFASPGDYTAWEILLAFYGYALQIYCDFSGYSDMAIGIARMLGYDLGINFRHPYAALNLTDFWRRWHISLSSWLREYLYIPLGGNRKGKVRTYINLFLTMLLGGLWHGASWNFILWGAAHGGGLAIHKLFDGWSGSAWLRRIPGWSVFAWLLTFHFVLVWWVYFRAKDFATAQELFGRLWTTSWDPAYLVQFVDVRLEWLILFVLGFMSHLVPERWRIKADNWFVQSPWLLKWILFMIVVQLVLQFRNENVQPFIYFQF